MERYINAMMGLAGIAMMLIAMSSYSFTNSPEFKFYSNSDQYARMLPPPDEMQLSQK